MKIFNKDKGFTLIELIVVVAIIGVLSGVVLQGLSSARAKARNTQRLENIDQIAKAFQIGTTGGSNQFPRSEAPGNPTTLKCLGKSQCWGGGYYNLASVDAIINNGISGGKVPVDPLWNTGMGDAVGYNSDATVPGARGAYLFWRMEDLGSSTSCGRGSAYVDVSNPTYKLCRLLLGPSTP